MPSITLSPKYPRDVRPAELETLAQELRVALAGLEPDLVVHVEPGEDDHRVAITFTEIVNLVIAAIGGAASMTAITQAVGSWMKARSKEKADRRPRTVNIFGPNGEVIRRVEIDEHAKDVRVIDVGKK